MTRTFPAWLLLIGVLAGTLPLKASGGISKELLMAGKLESFEDRKRINEPPESHSNDMFDFVDRTVFKQVRSWFDVPRVFRWLVGNPKQAVNIDAFDEVPNSSWFTNRTHSLSLEDVLRGPDRGTGPDMTSSWFVTGAKTEGSHRASL